MRALLPPTSWRAARGASIGGWCRRPVGAPQPAAERQEPPARRPVRPVRLAQLVHEPPLLEDRTDPRVRPDPRREDELPFVHGRPGGEEERREEVDRVPAERVGTTSLQAAGKAGPR